MLRVKKVEGSERPAVAPHLQKLEQRAVYPLGDDFFKIDHGTDPFAFFDQMGEASTWAAFDGDDLAGVATGVLRTLPSGRAWYACDLKVDEGYRRRGVAKAIALRAVPVELLRCSRGYGVAMLPQTGEAVAQKWVASLPDWLIAEGPRLNLYSLSAAQTEALTSTIEEHRGRLTFANHFGTKDIVLKSTGAPMPLWHCQFGPLARNDSQAKTPTGASVVVMLCTVADDALDLALSAAELSPSATAQVLHRGMSDETFDWLLTSDI